MNAKIYYFIHPEGGTVTTMDAERTEYYTSGGYVEVSREAYKLHSDFYNLYGECGMLAVNAKSIIEAEKAK